MGVALTLTDGRDAGTLLRHADVAMYRAKASHAEHEFYASDRDEHTSARLALAGELRHALDERELTPWFQPVLELASGRIVGAEALVRWQHPVRGLILPDAFIPVVEQTNLLRPMTLLVLERAIERCATWRATGLDLTVAVNLSARNLEDEALPGDVARMLAAAGLPGSAITLEITESAMMADPVQAQETLGRLRALGVRIAVDDFGTGHAALAYLKRLPVTELKIDRTFVTGLDVNDDDRAIVRSTIELAHDLGLRCVAEGVETSWTWRWLAAHHCDLAQGWLMGMAVPADEFEDLVRRRRPGAVEDAPPTRVVHRRTASGDLVRRGSRRPPRPRERMQ